MVGPDDAPITFIEYADFQCPACARLHNLRQYLLETYEGEIRFAYRHLPLTGIHDKAVIAAEATEAAAAQGKFWEMHDLLYEKQEEWQGLSEDEIEDKLVEYAEELELDADQFAQELSDHAYREQIMTEYEAYQEYGRMATPTYVINKIFYPTQELGGFERIKGFIQLVQMRDQMYDSLPPEVIDPDKEYIATIRTTKGDIVVELLPNQAPVNVNSFAFLAQEGWYDGQDFFYVDPEAVALSGAPTAIGAGLPFTGYYCGDETTPDLTFDEPGMLALYALGPNLNSSSFFITYAPQPRFNGKLTIIGRVTEGMDVAKSLRETQPGSDQPEPDSIKSVMIEER